MASPKTSQVLVLAASAALLVLLAAAGIGRAPGAPAGFPQASADYFAGMDGGIALDAEEVRGRNTWLMWSAGDEAFWDELARHSSGAFDLLKVLDSRGRATRFSYYGLMNEPGFKQATAPDGYGLWLDAPDGTRDGAYAADYREAFPRDEFLRTYGRASGIVGLRLFPNPAFDAAAQAKWDARKFYDDRAYYSDRNLIRPYRVGMACGFCHVGPHPLHPPAEPERPQWQNLSSNIGNQYLRPAHVFVLPHNEDNFLFQVVNSMPPGTIDTSALASDNINNPRNMNAIYQVATRLAIASKETLAGGNLDMPGTAPEMAVPHVLKDGADSIGINGALARVYFSIGSFHEEWTKHFNLLVGGQKQTPMPIALARQASPYVRATLERLDNVAKFFVAVSKPHPLAEAPGGTAYLQDSAETVARGRHVFAEECAACHVSPNKMPSAPPGQAACGSPAWKKWARSADFTSKMAELMGKSDFLTDNYLSTDQPCPDSTIGTNLCAALASNAVRGHIWDNFSSQTYKHRPAIGIVGINDPFTGQMRPYVVPGGGRGYQRVPSLVSIWASAPYLHNNSVGVFTGDPQVSGRMTAFEDGMKKLLQLSPEKRLGMASIYRTTQESSLFIEKSWVPAPLFKALAKKFGLPDGANVIRIGPIPKGTPVNLIANIDLEPTFNPVKLVDFAAAIFKVNAALKDIHDKKLDDAAAAARLQQLAPALLKLSKCPDFVTDRGHLFGTGLPDADKRALIAYLKRL
jgi:hypothetical protein